MACIDNRIGRNARLAAAAGLAAALTAAAPAWAQQRAAPSPASPAPASPAPMGTGHTSPSPAQTSPGAAQASPGQAQSNPTGAPGGPAGTQAGTETVEQRIASLHDALKITPAQEPKWQAVAKAMRENAAAMDKLMGENQATDPEKVTAVQSLVIYTRVARAHVAGLQNLTDDFRALYQTMPPDQKKLADQVFRTAGG